MMFTISNYFKTVFIISKNSCGSYIPKNENYIFLKRNVLIPCCCEV